MKLIERIALFEVLAAFLLRVMLFKAVIPFMIIGLSLLSMIYFYFGFALFNGIGFRGVFKKASFANVSTSRIIGAVGFGLALSIISIGILFKLLIWNGANEMLIIGASVLFCILVIAGVTFLMKKKPVDVFYKGIFMRGIAALILACVLFFVPGRALIQLYYRNDPEVGELMIRAQENPNDEESQKALDKAMEEERK
jgi:glucan phosphoethanolaminetransferase (alkaline phosphatase superfamily)